MELLEGSGPEGWNPKLLRAVAEVGCGQGHFFPLLFPDLTSTFPNPTLRPPDQPQPHFSSL